MKISVTGDVRQVSRSLKKAQRQMLPAAVPPALNRAVKKAHTAAVRGTARSLGIKQKRIRRRIRHQKQDKATRKKWISGLYSVLTDMPASYFGKPRQLKKGAKVRKKTYVGAFVAPMPQGHIGVYRRKTKKRYPLVEEKVKVSNVFEHESEKAITKVAAPEFSKRLKHEIKFRLKKAGL